MQGDLASSLLLPASLGFIMFSLGLGLTVPDFIRILHQPRALLVGILCHFVLLPLVCFGLIQATGITGAFAVGFMILASCPTGTTSNLLTYLARGDVALALSFTAVASVITIFTLPFIVSWALSQFMGTSREVAVPVGQIMINVFVMLGLPVSLGMGLRAWREALAKKLEPRLTKIATLLFVLVVAVAVIKNWVLVREHIVSLAPLAFALNLTMLACGFIVAWLARLPRRQAVTLGIETAVQNATLALVIAGTVLHNDAMAVPGAVYGVVMYGGGMLFALTMRRFTASADRQH
ncbi:MAG: bile acid:sodium symporter family protein [Rubrivivax sp.]|nr:MAG: bile acid:sodium symporter family protein [Rubrivivax sp.]